MSHRSSDFFFSGIAAVITAKVALQISIDPQQRVQGKVIDVTPVREPDTHEVMERGSGETTSSYRTSLLKRADAVKDRVTINRRPAPEKVELLPPGYFPPLLPQG
jgi:hypothetical protein